MLIRAYGTFWNPDMINWGARGAGNKGELKGKVKINNQSHVVDFWNGKGIYVLYAEFSAVYVGQAFSKCLGARVRDHLTDRFAGRWDMFSWFTLSTVNRLRGDVKAPGKRQIGPNVVNDTLEALAILIADPPFNRKREKIPNALPAEQLKDPHPHTVRHYLETIISKLDTMAQPRAQPEM